MTALSLAFFRRCAKCGITYPLNGVHFHAARSGSSKLASSCKGCHRLRAKLWKRRNPDYGKNWRKQNPEYHYQYNKRFRQENADSVAVYMREYSRKYRQANAEKAKQYLADWHERNPNYNRMARARRRAALLRSEGTHSTEDVQEILTSQAGLCAYCETPLDSFHVDHMIPLSRGGRNDWTNLAATCVTCNLRKHDKTVEEFFNQ